MSEYQYYEFLALDRPLTEPPVPPGLKNLSAGLQAVVDFFEIDENLIAVVAASSPAIEEPGGLAEWIASLAAEEKVSCVYGTTASRACRNGLIRRACRADERRM